MSWFTHFWDSFLEYQDGEELKQKNRKVLFYNGSKHFLLYKCYNIFIYNMCKKTPLCGQNTSKVWNYNSPKISPHVLFEIFEKFNSYVLHFALKLKRKSDICSFWPQQICVDYLDANIMRHKVLSEIFGRREKERQSSEFLNTTAPIDLRA